MKRTVTSTEAASNLSALLEAVRSTREPIIIISETGEEVVLVSAAQYRQIEQMKQQAWDLVRAIRLRNKDVDPDEIYREVTAAVEEVRAERRERAGA